MKTFTRKPKEDDETSEDDEKPKKLEVCDEDDNENNKTTKCFNIKMPKQKSCKIM